ncbi:hypothetical protein N7478_006225 [Penicillium angulare]|uniref:uncharacterized protein n=1 Tax=Penicillium angulare TaxID=116970 RepID=UPI00254151A8|nr:uncharacterized protein N7478_006225 [Penicillium angulare]KAJ5280853.1 hypothetical protein N7478_006225 [Penicillium angulare]
MTMMPMDVPRPTMRSGPETYMRQHSNHFDLFPTISEPLTENSLINQAFQPELQASMVNPNISIPYDDFLLYDAQGSHSSFQQYELYPSNMSVPQPMTPQWNNEFCSIEVPRSMRRSASEPPMRYQFIPEDPTNPHTYHEKRPRSRTELDKQKEDIRQLKEYGGACNRCYKSKKKCGPSTPCPPCRANKRECIRREPPISGHKEIHISDAEISTSPSVVSQVVGEILDFLQPGPWEPQLIPSIDGTYCDVDTGFIHEPEE